MTSSIVGVGSDGPDEPVPACIRERLARLAPDQRAAATSPPGPILCVAPAGSGKTTTLVARIAWRLAGGVEPGRMCALTFNRRAAEELQERADAALGELGVPPGSVRVRTFHALGRAILAEAGVDVGRIVERQALLAELAGGPLLPEAQRWLDDAFTRLKLDPERGPPADDVATHQAFAEYQAALVSRRAIDLDDLVARAVPALRDDGVLLSRWRERAAVLFVDEAQDLDRCQLDLALLLAGDRRDIFLVGDDDQTIYAWRLADVRRVLDLAACLPGLRRVDLETNHRCAPEVVLRAARLVAHNRERFDKVIRASPTASGSVTLLPDEGDPVARARSCWGLAPREQWRGDGKQPGRAGPHERRAGAVRGRGPGAGHPRAGRGRWPPAGADGPLGYRRPRPRPGRSGCLTAPCAGARHPGDAARWRAWHGPPGVGGAVQPAARPTGRAARASVGPGSTGKPRGRIGRPHPGDLPCHEGSRVGPRGLHRARRGHLPGRAALQAVDPGRVLEEERRLAYVAWTRARRTLTLVYDPGAPSLPARGLRGGRAGRRAAVTPPETAGAETPNPPQRTLRRSTE